MDWKGEPVSSEQFIKWNQRAKTHTYSLSMLFQVELLTVCVEHVYLPTPA
ncbi:hypothetical protein ACRALDRAFT_2018613 [Sodiomyces alcalophilus JCM 7366]